MNLQDLIGVFPNCISYEDCDQIVKWFHNNQDIHIHGHVYGNGDSGYNKYVKDTVKKASQAYPSPDDPISDLLTSIISKSYRLYCDQFPSPSKTERICVRDYSVRVYEKNDGYFLTHVDQGSGGTVGRIFAIIMYLNDVEEGGETAFPEQNVLVKPERGKVLIFPCNYMFPHCGNMPISNDKYIATAFVNYLTLEDLSK